MEQLTTLRFYQIIINHYQMPLLEKFQLVVYFKVTWQEKLEIKQWQQVRNHFIQLDINLKLLLAVDKDLDLFGVDKIKILLILIWRIITVKSQKVDTEHLINQIRKVVRLWDHPIDQWLIFRRETSGYQIP